MLRETLSYQAPQISPRDWRFVRSEAGRPSLAPPFDATGLHFSVSHSAGLVAIAIGRMPLLGIDVEHENRAISPAIARRYFSESEVAALELLPPEQHQRHLLRLWTLKEAYLKAIGTGVAGGLGSATFRFQDAAIDFERDDDPHAKRWSFREFAPRGFMLALAYHDAAAGTPAQPWVREYHGRSDQEQRPQP
jgi:4'-phosphopantetheinyl transferase